MQVKKNKQKRGGIDVATSPEHLQKLNDMMAYVDIVEVIKHTVNIF